MAHAVGSALHVASTVTERRYLADPYERECEAVVLESEGGACTLSRTLFHPGGGGQPHDRGALVLEGDIVPVTGVHEDEGGRIWHETGRTLAVGAPVTVAIEWPFRYALMRHHALMHVVNTVAMKHFGGIITGAQLGVDRSRIDFRLPSFAREQITGFQSLVNEIIDRDLPITSFVISEDEFRARPELIRTLNVLPPVVDGQVRVVEIRGFDTQACGGTHVHTTREIGQARIVKFDNKGKDNKRFYWEVETGT